MECVQMEFERCGFYMDCDRSALQQKSENSTDMSD